MIEKFSVGMQKMYIHTPGWHTFYFVTFMSVSVTWWPGWRSGQRWRSVWRCCRSRWRCAGSIAPPACLRILSGAILAWKAAVRLICMNHRQVSFYRGLHLLMPRKLNSSRLLFPDFGARFLNCLLHFHLLWQAKSLLWPFWPYSRQGACQTVLVVPDLLALP